MVRKGELGWIIFLAGLPFAPFLNHQLDLWHAHSAWVHLVLMVLVLYATTQPHRPMPRPLNWWMLWVTVLSWWLWQASITTSKTYPFALLASWTHLFTIWLFVLASMIWDEPLVHSLIRAIRWSGLIMLAYGVLQLANLDQFFDSGKGRDVLVGTIGNPSHLAAYFSILLPLYLLGGKRWSPASLVTIGLILCTKSMTGQLAMAAVLLWWSLFQPRWVTGLLLAIGGLGLAYLWFHREGLNTWGRWEAWTIFWNFIKQKSILGYGPGFTMQLSQTITERGPIFQWRHCHNEFLQVWLEQGIVGLGLVIWTVWDAAMRVVRKLPVPHMVALGGMLLAFGINSLLNFPAHLWMTGSLGLMAYCGIYTLTESA